MIYLHMRFSFLNAGGLFDDGGPFEACFEGGVDSTNAITMEAISWAGFCRASREKTLSLQLYSVFFRFMARHGVHVALEIHVL